MDDVTGTAGHTWHNRTQQETIQALETAATGLSAAQARDRLARYGPNQLPRARPRSALRRLIDQFRNLLILILLGAVALSIALGHWLDASVIAMVVVVNVLLGFFQEGRAENALTAIRGMLAGKTTAMRDGRRRTLPSRDLVPGDLILLEAGDRVPADVRLIGCHSLAIDESALTGESLPVEKRLGVQPVETELAERQNMAFSGTLVTRGHGRGLVVATARDTEVGRIGQLLETVQPLDTPLLRQINQLGRTLTLIILVLALVVYGIGTLGQALPPSQTFIAVISLAIAGIPEGLPTILTVAMAVGVRRMAGRRAIIRRLPAVETLGAVSVICTDKTGTLTRNEMTATAVVLSDRTLSVSGSGYRPDGGFRQDGDAVTAAHLPRLRRLTQAGALCSDASLSRIDGDWQLTGDPMEGALLALAMKAGESPMELAKQFPRLDEIPFDSRHQYMATLHHDHKGHHFVLLKGAPERVVALCPMQRNGDGDAPIDRPYWLGQLERMAGRGQRVLAIAIGSVSENVVELDRNRLFGSLSLWGLVGLLDPPREAAVEAVAQARKAGIEVKMITGDHASTARSIGSEMGLDSAGHAVSGPTLDGLDPQGWRQVADQTSIFARATPEHKLRLVEALQAGGHIVAMTGDGVNDAPALKRADIGIAMGRKGTEAAREAAAMVLADDNFESITRAILEGRAVFDNLRKAVIFFLPINGGESASIMLALLLALNLPIEPLQLLWVNMVSSVCLALVLAFERPEPDIMQRPPRTPREPLVSGFLIWRVSFVSILFTAGIFGIYELAISHGSSIAVARTMAVNTLAAMEVFYLFSVRYLRSTSLTLRGLRGTPVLLAAIAAVVLAQLMFTYAPWMHEWFASAALEPLQLALPALAGMAVFMILELEKLVLGRWRRPTPATPETAQGSDGGTDSTGRAVAEASTDASAPGRETDER